MSGSFFALLGGSFGSEKRLNIFNLFLFIVLLAAFVFIALMIFEFRERRRANKRFVHLSAAPPPPSAASRSIPRITIPDALNVRMAFSTSSGSTIKARMIDISAAGFCIRTDAAQEDVEVNRSLHDVRVKTPINEFAVSELKPIWIVEETNRKLLGMQIVSMEEGQLQLMNDFIFYLKEYLLHGT